MAFNIKILSSVALTFVVTSLVYWAFFHKLNKTRKRQLKLKMKDRIQSRDQVKAMVWHKVGTVSDIWIYPVKSCAAVKVNTANVQREGLTFEGMKDRSLILVNKKGVMVTARVIGNTVLIQPSITGDILTLNYPDMESISVNLKEVAENKTEKPTEIWNEKVSGFDCGDTVSEWLSAALGKTCRLLYHADIPSPRITADQDGIYPLLRDDDNALYADLTGFMLMNNESLKDLKTRVSCHIAPQNFRPNILVEGAHPPYSEDTWEYVKIGNAVFRNAKPCDRCIFTTIDYSTGKKDPNMEPLKTLRKYRCEGNSQSPLFGINLGMDLAGTIADGDDVYVTLLP